MSKIYDFFGESRTLGIIKEKPKSEIECVFNLSILHNNQMAVLSEPDSYKNYISRFDNAPKHVRSLGSPFINRGDTLCGEIGMDNPDSLPLKIDFLNDYIKGIEFIKNLIPTIPSFPEDKIGRGGMVDILISILIEFANLNVPLFLNNYSIMELAMPITATLSKSIKKFEQDVENCKSLLIELLDYQLEMLTKFGNDGFGADIAVHRTVRWITSLEYELYNHNLLSMKIILSILLNLTEDPDFIDRAIFEAQFLND